MSNENENENEEPQEEFLKLLKYMNTTELGEFCHDNNIPVVVDKTKLKGVVIKQIVSFISGNSDEKKAETETSREDLQEKFKQDMEDIEFKLIEYSKEDLKVFVKKEHLSLYITSRMGKRFILEKVLLLIKKRNEERIKKSLQKKSLFGHLKGTVEACLDELIYEGSTIKEMSQGLLEESLVDTIKESVKTVKDYIEYLPREKGIVVILTMKPDPIENHAVALFDAADGRGYRKGKKRFV